MPLTTGQMLQNRYRIVSLLGRGGMGAVYRAWDTRLNIPLAAKEQVPQPGLDATMLSRLRHQFIQEAQILARLDHPHLVKVSDYFEEGGKSYLIMRFVEGESLAARIEREGALNEAQVLTWAGQLLTALIYCHHQGVLHRDLKPQNVIITPQGQAVLVDFGLVKLWNPNDPVTRTAIRGVGTPEYAPPEQYDTEAGHTDTRSDIYGLGATIYHALTGQAPPTVTQRIINPHLLRSVRTLRPTVSVRTETTIMQSLEMQPERRFQSAQVMLAALTQAAPSESPCPMTEHFAPSPPLGRTPTSEPKAGWWKKIPVWGWAASAVVILLILGISALAGWKWATPADTGTATATATPRAGAGTLTPGAGIGASTATPRATSTPISTPSPTPIPTSTPFFPTTLSANIFQDTFDSDSNGWATGSHSSDWWSGSQHITGGKYVWEVDETYKGFISWSTPIEAPNDFYISVNAQRIAGPTTSCYALVYRRTEEGDYYRFKVCDTQLYTLDLQYEDEWQKLIDWTSSDLIRPGEANKLAIKAIGDQFDLFINDHTVGSVTDATLNGGDAGLAISMNEGEVATFEFDDFVLRKPYILRDTFDTNLNSWLSGTQDNEWWAGSAKIEDGKYIWEIDDIYKSFIYWTTPIEPPDDSYISVDVQRISGPTNACYVLIFRQTEEGDYYRFKVCDTQRYTLGLREGEEWQTLVAWTESDVIRPGQVNTLGVKAVGSRFDLFINQRLVDSFIDDTLSSGDAGIAISMSEGDGATFVFDEFLVRYP